MKEKIIKTKKHCSKTFERALGAREIAKTWSEITAYYIRNGGSFESIQPKLKRKGIIKL